MVIPVNGQDRRDSRERSHSHLQSISIITILASISSLEPCILLIISGTHCIRCLGCAQSVQHFVQHDIRAFSQTRTHLRFDSCSTTVLPRTSPTRNTSQSWTKRVPTSHSLPGPSFLPEDQGIRKQIHARGTRLPTNQRTATPIQHSLEFCIQKDQLSTTALDYTDTSATKPQSLCAQ